MSVYRRFVHARKGMSTIFGAIFFVILILMGFNLMTWNFLQYDAYNGVVTSMKQRDQQAASEGLAATAPGATGFAGNSFNITVGNTGGASVTVTRVYIFNLSPSGSTQCSAGVCIVDPVSPVNCAGNGNCVFLNANVQVGENNHNIRVTGLTINDGSGYKVVLSSMRGRQFSFYYPWPVNIFASNSNSTNTAHGSLDVKFDVNTFNFTQGTQTVSQPAWNVPYNVNLVFWVKVTNNAIYPITLSKYSDLYLICERYGLSGEQDCENVVDFFVSDDRTVNPSSILAYDEVNRPVVLPAAGPNGPTGFTIVKFGSFTPSSTTANKVSMATPYLFFLVFFYKVNGLVVGQTLTFFAVRACTTYPSCP